MRIDQHPDRLAGLALDRGAKRPRQPRILLRVDREQPCGVSIAPALESPPAPIQA